jgi:hypothetical protein
MSIIINKKEYYGVIYKIENIINHHVYIGQTSEHDGFNGRYRNRGNGIERVYNYYLSRKSRDLYYNRHLFSAIEKYGFEAFVVDEILDTALTFEELNDKEAFYVKQFDSLNNGYNSTEGGDRKTGYRPPSGKDCRHSKRICQISLDGKLIKIWDGFGDIQRETGISKGSVANVCAGNKKTAGGFVWTYEEDYDPNKDYGRIPKIKDGGKGTKPVLLLDKNNNVLQEFYSVNHVGDVLDVSAQEVSRICNHRRKNPKYNLIYKSEYIEEQRLNVKDSYEVAS